MDEISTDNKNNENNLEKNQPLIKNKSSETKNKIQINSKLKIKLQEKEDLSNEVLYFSINQENK